MHATEADAASSLQAAEQALQTLQRETSGKEEIFTAEIAELQEQLEEWQRMHAVQADKHLSDSTKIKNLRVRAQLYSLNWAASE